MAINAWQLATQIKTWVAKAAENVKDHLHDHLSIQTKSGRNDLVTNIDKATEQFLVRQIRETYPDAQIVGEEGFGDDVTNLDGLVFFVDPIDGTMNFVKEKENFGIMIGAYENGQGVVGVILDVMNNDLFWGGPAMGVFKNNLPLPKPEDVALEDGLIGMSGPLLIHDVKHVVDAVEKSAGARITGSAGIEYTKILQGTQNGYISYLKPWDVAAGKVMAETLGLKVTDIDGKPLSMLSSKIVLIGTERTHAQIIAMQQMP